MTLTKNDLSRIEQIVDQKLDEKLDEKLTDLKSDFYERIDLILKEVVTSRDERSLIENRVESLEKIHQKGQHSLVN